MEINSLRVLKDEWDQIDKSNFSEKLEFEYDENDPLYVKLKEMSDELEMPLNDLISALIYKQFKSEIQKS